MWFTGHAYALEELRPCLAGRKVVD